jgi:hypothetical protein
MLNTLLAFINEVRRRAFVLGDETDWVVGLILGETATVTVGICGFTGIGELSSISQQPNANSMSCPHNTDNPMSCPHNTARRLLRYLISPIKKCNTKKLVTE